MEPPSVLSQTSYASGFFEFGKAKPPEVALFNPSITRRPDGLWLVARRCDTRFNHRIGANSLMAFKLDDALRPQHGVAIRSPVMSQDENIEDPRAFYVNGRFFVSACNFLVFDNGAKYTGSHQTLLAFDEHWNILRRHEPVYGRNGPTIEAPNGHEKNWTWFTYDNSPHLLYTLRPLTIARFSRDFYARETSRSYDDEYHWPFGEPRGGSNPLLGPDGLFWTFFHSSCGREGGGRRYYMGAAAFTMRPSPRLVRISREPILTGSLNDPARGDRPPCVFPCGAILENGTWTVSMGINDTSSAWIKIPHSDLSRLTEPTTKTVVNPRVSSQVKLMNLDAGKLYPYGYNPTIGLIDGAMRMAYRYHPDPERPATQLAIARLSKSWEVEDNLTIPVPGISAEDPKFCEGGNRMYMSWVESDVTPPNRCSVQYGFFAPYEGMRLKVIGRPEYGLNDGEHVEKNWVFFLAANNIWLLYQSQPEQVVVRWSGTKETEHRTPGPKWDWGHIKGGTAPVRCGVSTMVRIFHSTVDRPYGSLRRTYYIGACLMSRKPPFEVLKVSSKPIICGSAEDDLLEEERTKLKHWKPGVVFCSGLVKDGDHFYLSLGINDSRCAIARLELADLHLT